MTQSFSKGFLPIWLIVMIILAVVGGGAVLVLQKKPQATPSPAPLQTLAPSVSVQPSETPTISPSVDTSTWKTYRNEQYSYALRYPAEWEKEIGYREPDDVVFTHSRLFGDIKETYAKLYISAREESQDFISQWNNIKPNMTIGGIPAVQLESEEPTGATLPFTDKSYSILRGAVLYGIHTTIWRPEKLIKPQKVDYQAIFNEILSTFKFIP